VTELTETEARPENELLDEVDAAERLPSEIEPAILRKYFSLTRADLDEVERCRGPANKLGFSAQLCTLRWRGHFLADTRDVPAVVLEMLALARSSASRGTSACRMMSSPRLGCGCHTVNGLKNARSRRRPCTPVAAC
jgi:hypothetical protein